MNNIGTLLLWLVAAAMVAFFWEFYFWPYIHNKWIFWTTSRELRKMAKKYPGETGDKLNEIAKAL